MDHKNKSVCEQNVFQSIYNQYSDLLYRFIYYKCGDRQQAEDIVQETFIKLWKNCSKVLFTKAKSYIYTVARNLFLNEVAHQKIVLEHLNLQEQKNDSITPQYLLEEKEFLGKLKLALEKLPDKQREVFLLSRVDQKKYSEIAEIVGISVKAVEKRMSQALQQLRDQLIDN
ncbi:RNA polymerase sigma factor [Aestuariibaculum sediminum]|uniref:RNA polymerase sigma-70 factor n=1 Tax=Aestuariibaculum sediminum TaxID=2770637 RepID=A0A8J6Q1S8_9FLAO|nr:RNA polymerase sigma-70 factor [Aestuariibaculum sediminum]MBD0831236.1 RNA polymerase sigma-70 factor [Aestuariibaculum sediminum]